MSFDNDQLMVRTVEPGGFSLSAGEPSFLQDTLSFLKTVEVPTEPLRYPALGGEKDLLEELHRLHPEFKYIVVANGCKQALLGSLHALSQTRTFETIIKERNKEPVTKIDIVHGRHLVYHKAPYWPSYTTLARLSGMHFTSRYDPNAIRIVTSPGNPDGTEIEDNEPVDVLDNAYINPIFPVYGHTKRPKALINCFSGSKMFGLSGIRIGWMGTDDPFIAKKVAEYVESSTTGVSLLSQLHMASVLRHVRRFQDAVPEFIKAQKVLHSNFDSLGLLLGEFCIKMNVEAKRGMFGFIQLKDPPKFDLALKSSKVSVVPGKACGMKEDGWYRLSLGWGNDYTQRALQALRKELLNA
jgi:histidinol-phosphate/aromatic aminotransferase/cobyric acid decarboxylase-like protein